jgi:hypothetical protein
MGLVILMYISNHYQSILGNYGLINKKTNNYHNYIEIINECAKVLLYLVHLDEYKKKV